MDSRALAQEIVARAVRWRAGSVATVINQVGQRYLDEVNGGHRLLRDLRTEAGRAAYAVANGWPTPEERAAWERDRAAAREGLTALQNEVDELREKVGVLDFDLACERQVNPGKLRAEVSDARRGIAPGVEDPEDEARA